jgi:hypothetical protein
MRALMTCTPHQTLFGCSIKKNEMGVKSSMQERGKRYIGGLGGETLGKVTTWKTQI